MHKKYHLQEQEIPDGFQIYHERCQVMGVALRQRDAAAFCKGSGKQALEFEPEPSNSHDPNAIRIWGCWKGWLGKRRKLLGYVDRDEAARIAKLNLAGVVRPRLLKTYVGGDGFVEVLFQVLGPVEHAKVYKRSK